MTNPTRSNRFAAPLLAASFALLALVSGCSGSFAQPADFPHARDFTPPARERTAAHEHHQTTQAPATARAFERAERAPATPVPGPAVDAATSDPRPWPWLVPAGSGPRSRGFRLRERLPL